MRPEPRLTVSEWADRYRWLPPTASEPGRWRTSRTPYLREIMDALSPWHPAEIVVLEKGAQVGAPLAIDTPIATPAGWTPMGEIAPGDRVFDETGAVRSVVGVSEILRGRQCYELEFSDGSVVVADEGHLWTVWDEKKYEHRRQVTVTTAQLYANHKVKTPSRVRNRFALEVTAPLDLPDADLPIAPYALGAWLGDGSSYSNQITTFSEDVEIAEHITESGHPAEVRWPEWLKGRTCNIIIEPKPAVRTHCQRGHDLAVVGVASRGRCRKCQSQATMYHRDGKPMDPILDPIGSGFCSKLKHLGLIGSKHIPAAYLRASYQQRLALVQGMMDTDGHITKKGRCSFCSVRRDIADSFYELLISLGIKARISCKQNGPCLPGGATRKVPSVVYRVDFLVYRDKPVFRLKRKLARMVDRQGRRTTETERRRIIRVTPVPSVPTRCIAVDSPSHLFLAGKSMIPTHNTESGLNWLGYVIHHAPGLMLMVYPGLSEVKRNTSTRINPLVESTPELRERVAEPRSRDGGNSIFRKKFPGGELVMTGSNSAVGLRSTPARYLFLDEVDGYPSDADGEGDPVDLAMQRTVTFRARRKIFMASTPTVDGRSRIQAAYDETDQRRYLVPCKHCGDYSVITWVQIKWPDGRPEEAVWICPKCGGVHEEYDKKRLLEEGEWRPTVEHRDNSRVGFHLSALYSPWATWAESAAQFVKVHRDPSRLKTWVNLALGEPWKERGEAPEWRRLYDRRESYQIGTVPRGGLLLTAGVDVQADRLEAEVVAWGRDQQSWSVDYRVMMGNTALLEDPVWDELTALLGETWTHESGVDLGLVRMAVDDGYNSQIVRSWARRHKGARVMVVKGQDRASVPVGRPTAVDVDRAGKRITRGVQLWPIGVSLLKHELYGWLRMDPPTKEALEAGEGYPPGYCHFPEYAEEHFRQLTAEEVHKVTRKGYTIYEWVKTRDRNESLDARIYARAGAIQYGVTRFGDGAWDELVRQFGDEAVQARSESDAPVVGMPRRKRRRRSVQSSYVRR